MNIIAIFNKANTLGTDIQEIIYRGCLAIEKQ
jgi:hypothetical protein